MDLLTNLNDKQQEAVLATEGPVLVIAGAGSGKTRALTHRIAYLIKEKKVSPMNILAVTFTNKAAGEMKERIANLLGRTFDVPTVGTFHSLCVRLLRKYIHLFDFENNFTIYDTTDTLILMKHLMQEIGFSEKELNPRSVLSHISTAKNQLITPEQFQGMVDSSFAGKVASLYGPYQKKLKGNSALDFDDLIMKTVQIFQKFESVLNECQERFKYISVDEYQDTNMAQYVLINLLAKKYRNLCVIGDGDQSIYGWRGANMQNILDFEKEYPDAKVIKLEQNYRSTQPILDTAHHIIVKNKKRKEKNLWTERVEGNTPHLYIAENERHEGELVAQEILDSVRGHETPDYRDFVVLYRINAQSRILEEVMLKYGIPYKIVGGLKFYARKEIKDMVAYLRVIQNTNDMVSLLRIINVPARNIGDKTLEALQNFANIKDCSLFEAMHVCDEIGGELTDAKKESIKNFVSLIKKLQKVNREFTVSGVIKHVLDMAGYKKFLDDGTIEGESRLENVKELISVASKYDKLEPGMSLGIFLEEVSLISDLDTLEEKENAVTLMTLHSAKGLEFPWVFICGLEEGLLPHSRSLIEPEELEEERRLFYVGITRAMDRLFLLYAKNRMLYGEMQQAIPSHFLLDIPENLLIKKGNEINEFVDTGSQNPSKSKKKWMPFGYRAPVSRTHQPIMAENPKPIPEETGAQFFDGDKVRHSKWGDGIIVQITGGIATVAFKDPKIGIKKLAISVAPLEKI